MAYVYRVTFDLDRREVAELQIGSPLERAIGYLRALLPAMRGFETVRAMESLDDSDSVEVALESVWLTWEDLDAHRGSGLLEEKILMEFGKHVPKDALRIRIYQDVP